MKRSGLGISAAVFAAFLQLTNAWGAIGVETGNGKFREFESDLGSFRIQIPERWKPVEFPQNLVLLDQQPKLEQAAVLNLAWSRADRVTSVLSLRSYLATVLPGREWSEVLVANRVGLISTENGMTSLYVVQGAGKVFSASYRVNEKSLTEIGAALEQLEFRD